MYDVSSPRSMSMCLAIIVKIQDSFFIATATFNSLRANPMQFKRIDIYHKLAKKKVNRAENYSVGCYKFSGSIWSVFRTREISGVSADKINIRFTTYLIFLNQISKQQTRRMILSLSVCRCTRATSWHCNICKQFFQFDFFNFLEKTW